MIAAAPRIAGYATMIGLGLAVVIGTAWTTTQARAPRDLTPDTVVAEVGTGGAPRSPELIAALKATRAAPEDVAAAHAAARLLIDEGRASGDSRTVGAAIAVLEPFMARPDAGTLYLSAEARQYQHDFDGALDLLARAIAVDPDAINPRLMQATIHIVQGHLRLARRECAGIAALGAPTVALLCQSTSQTMDRQAPQAARRLQAMLAQPGMLDQTETAWATGLLGEIAALQGDAARGREQLARLIEMRPAAIRERLILADLLLAADRPADAGTLLAAAPPVDGVLIRRVLAARARGAEDRASLAEIARRVQLNLDLGLTAHAREEADYFLRVADDPAAALARARVNWGLQHEYEDASLLVRAAVATGQPGAAAPVARWMADEGLTVPALDLPDAVLKAAE